MTHMIEAKQTRGGARKGSGARLKYLEQTQIITFRCPKSKVEEIKQLVKSTLKEHETRREQHSDSMR